MITRQCGWWPAIQFTLGDQLCIERMRLIILATQLVKVRQQTQAIATSWIGIGGGTGTEPLDNLLIDRVCIRSHAALTVGGQCLIGLERGIRQCSLLSR